MRKTLRKIKHINVYLFIPVFVLLFIVILYFNYKNNTKIFSKNNTASEAPVSYTDTTLDFTDSFDSFNPTIWKEYNGDIFDASSCHFMSNDIDFVNDELHLDVDQDTNKTTCAQYGLKENIEAYGKFYGEIKPIKDSGIITAMFVYREDPKQEIDIEFIGKDTTKVQFNVFYNPGAEGDHNNAPIQFPYLYNLGFDASLSFHQYGFEWLPNYINFIVDNKIVYTFTNTSKIPNLPMKFTLNAWVVDPNNSGVVKWGGTPDLTNLPQTASFKDIQIYQFNS